MRKAPGGRKRMPSLGHILILVAFGSVMLPAVLVSALVTLTEGRIAQGPVMRIVVTSREVSRAVKIGAKGRLEARADYAPPASLDLVIADERDIVVFSTIPSIEAGARTSISAVAALAQEHVPAGSFYCDPLEIDGKAVGTWYAILPTDAVRSLLGETTPLLRFTGFFTFAGFAFLFSIGAAAMLASQVGRLERAAAAIAAGDLETPISARGSREIVALAEAMERMRASIREDLGRRSRFLAAISHDLRTPLTAIGGYLEAVEDGLASDPATLARYVGVMKEKTRVLEDRIQGLIEFARMETREWRLSFERQALLPLFRGFLADAEEECALAGARLRSDLSDLGDFEAPVDRGLLARAFENLISNGLRYGRPGGLITVRARRDSGRRGPLLLIDVEDEGPGVPAGERELVFEAFWRGSAAREGEGSGIGLYIARSIIRGHGWDLLADTAVADSSQGTVGGARFSIAIPLEASDEGVSAEKPAGRGLREATRMDGGLPKPGEGRS